MPRNQDSTKAPASPLPHSPSKHCTRATRNSRPTKEEQGGGDGKGLPPAPSTRGGSNSSTGVHSRRNQRQPRAIKRGSHKNPWRVRLRQGHSPVAHDDPATLIGICTHSWRDPRKCSSGDTAEITPPLDTTQHAPHAVQPTDRIACSSDRFGGSEPTESPSAFHLRDTPPRSVLHSERLPTRPVRALLDQRRVHRHHRTPDATHAPRGLST